MTEIVIATSNPHKFRELVGLLALPGIRWRSLRSLRSLRDCSRLPVVREDGRTFEANAAKKARIIARATGCLALADDSGIEVEALEWAPGVRSARFAGRHGDDEANNAKLLKRLRGLPPSRRRARYRCALALADPRGLIGVVQGRWAGWIAFAPRGRGGFGYDPLFVVPRLGKTVGQLPARVKQRLSHRAQAARRLRPLLRRVVLSGPEQAGLVRRGC